MPGSEQVGKRWENQRVSEKVCIFIMKLHTYVDVSLVRCYIGIEKGFVVDAKRADIRIRQV